MCVSKADGASTQKRGPIKSHLLECRMGVFIGTTDGFCLAQDAEVTIREAGNGRSANAADT